MYDLQSLLPTSNWYFIIYMYIILQNIPYYYFVIGSRVNTKDTRWLTPLHRACASGNTVCKMYNFLYFIFCNFKWHLQHHLRVKRLFSWPFWIDFFNSEWICIVKWRVNGLCTHSQFFTYYYSLTCIKVKKTSLFSFKFLLFLFRIVSNR